MLKKRNIILFGVLFGTLLLAVVVVSADRARSASAASALPVHASSRSANHPATVDFNFCENFYAGDRQQISDCKQGFSLGRYDAVFSNCDNSGFNHSQSWPEAEYGGYGQGWGQICD